MSISFNGNDPSPTYGYVLSFSKSFDEFWGAVAELYGFESGGMASHFTGLGLSYLMNQDWQWDSYISSGQNRQVQELYISFGFSARTQNF